MGVSPYELMLREQLLFGLMKQAAEAARDMGASSIHDAMDRIAEQERAELRRQMAVARRASMRVVEVR